MIVVVDDPSADGPSVATYVPVEPSGESWYRFGGGSRLKTDLDRRTAAVLAAVLLAAAEQVSERKLAAFGVSRADELSLLQLSMAFTENDSGLVGDVFEWSVLLALNTGDSNVSSIVADALALAGVQIPEPRAVLVAAEGGRLVTYSPDLPAGATLATGKVGRPPLLSKILADSTTKTWKADMLIGQDERWVAASLKSNPQALLPSMHGALTTQHPPRIGITAVNTSAAGVIRHPTTGSIVAKLPVNGMFMALSKAVLSDVMASFRTHLKPPSTPLQQDASGIGEQLHRWEKNTVREVLSMLAQVAGEVSLAVGEVQAAGSSVESAGGSLIVADALTDYPLGLPFGDPGDRYDVRRLLEFKPID